MPPDRMVWGHRYYSSGASSLHSVLFQGADPGTGLLRVRKFTAGDRQAARHAQRR